MHFSETGQAIVRFPRYAADSPSLSGQRLGLPVSGCALEVVCADREGHAPLPVMVIDAKARQAWMLDSGTWALADALMPPMRPASLAVALALALGSLLYAPLALAAVAYAGHRTLRREFRRRILHADVEVHLRCALTDEPPSTDHRSVRSFQSSGNSTTSSILRR